MQTTRLFVLATMFILGLASFASAEWYGVDVVPSSTFHNGPWTHYGHDSIPSGPAHGSSLRRGYGLDAVTGTIRVRHDDPHHALIVETIQHLTGTTETTAEVEPTTKAYRSRCRCR